MNQTEETKLLEQTEEWNDADEFSRCIEAIEAIPEQERDYLLTVKLSRAYSNLAVLGDHGEHGTDSEVDGNLIQHAIRLLESVRTQGENDPYWNSRMGYSCLMAYSSAAIAYEYAKRWLSLAPDDPAAQKLVRDCEEYLEEEKALEIDLNVLSESFLHLLLRPIFHQSHPNFINVRTAYVDKIWAQLTKNLLAKSSTKRFREYIFERTGGIYSAGNSR